MSNNIIDPSQNKNGTDDDQSNNSNNSNNIRPSQSNDDTTNSTWKKMAFLDDPKNEMTWGRQIALFLMRFSWYNPACNLSNDDSMHSIDTSQQKKERISSVVLAEQPSLQRAWAYFEHVALTRYIYKDPNDSGDEQTNDGGGGGCCGDFKLDRAEPGETNFRTKLYHPFWTPHSQLGDFGLGVGLYFSTLRAIIVMTIVAGCISLPNIMYYASDEYMTADIRETIPTFIQGSAICPDTTWVPCPTCDCSSRDEWPDTRRCGTGTSVDGAIQNVTFALRNNCVGVTWELGMINYATLVFLIVSVVILGIYLRQQEVFFDEDEQTAQDYSMVITNPPSDASDPEEWRKFFKDNFDGAKVTVCTCAIDNDILIRTLLQRREAFRMIENRLEPGSRLDSISLAYHAAREEQTRSGFANVMAMILPGIPELFARVMALNAKVQGLAQLHYPVTNVFVTFETEHDQRHVLSKLSVGRLNAVRNNKSSLEDPKYLFRGETVLNVHEPEEPNAIRWEDLNTNVFDKIRQQILTIIATMAAIVVVAFVIYIASRTSTIISSFCISIANAAFPEFAKLLTAFEAHNSEGNKQTSLYFKIAAFRWVNTAILITIITPFTRTLALTEGLIPSIYTLFFAEIVTSNGIQLIDVGGHFKRHILGPRAATQDAMNLNFVGEEFELAERYTNVTKILFLAVWYCAIYPGGFFMCAIALSINYYTDRFSIMRTWKRSPHLGTTISKVSRHYFFSLAILAMAIISSFYWSGFPFDNLCPNDTPNLAFDRKFIVTPSVVKDNTFIGQYLGGEEEEESIMVDSTGGTDYRFCLQDLIQPGHGNTFPFIPAQQPTGDEWMTYEQKCITNLYGWGAVGVIILVAGSFVIRWIIGLRSLFAGSYEAIGEDQGIPFSQVETISAYIPQVSSKMYSYPLLACDVNSFDDELFDWTDPDRPHEYYDLTKDADELLNASETHSALHFTQVGHWDPAINPEDGNNEDGQ